MKFAYADPPYIGQAKKHYEGVEVDHNELIRRLCADYPDGWALSAGATTLHAILDMAPADVRIGIWVKSLVFFRPGVNPCYGWEAVIWRGGRKRDRYEPTIYDWHQAPTTLKTGVHGAKPLSFCFWVCGLLNAQPGDELSDLYPGTGAMGNAWDRYLAQYRLRIRTHGNNKKAHPRLVNDAPKAAWVAHRGAEGAGGPGSTA